MSSGERCTGPRSTASADSTRSPNLVVAEYFLHASRHLGGFFTAGVHHEQDVAFGAHCGPSATALRTALFERLPLQRIVGPRPQTQEVLDVAGRTGQRAGGDGDGVPLQCGGAAGDGEHRFGAQLRVGDDAACTHAILADLELRLHHGNDIGVGIRTRRQCRQHCGQ